ncbi:unnamed protein product [Aphanomyces euteiches]|uniref:PH domain-containing protein n=1 Tax=Aphanomyces euteiches TaxID=100861 RepID=A0A6G0WGC1_9STRA|nr:hypothetical protein Ae201684_015658 [Aphanomyces euteiches]KAH9093751.1 hypothetical protein Ae201684P_016373 [Aphanomyces euteiches]KAH9110131.1 hypothetical protein LEN26_013840 [Aphanomyces euteiches]KAH9111615.1 hypothetical protein AeMF1_013877 [Aphanomyces euteiches]KAH9141447.1 hypothetical protein AeRB84_014389 [Aphanomyces euteiches]
MAMMRDSDMSDISVMLESSRSLMGEHDHAARTPPDGLRAAQLQKVHEDGVTIGSLDSDVMLQMTDTDTEDDMYRSTPRKPETDKPTPFEEAKSPSRSGYVRIFFESSDFTSSKMLLVEERTTVLEVRKIMATKMGIKERKFDDHAILMVYVSGKGSSMSARTLKDDEFIFQVQEAIHSERQSLPEITNENSGPVRVKLRHRAHQTLKFVFKDVRGKPIDLEGQLGISDNSSAQDTVFLLPQKLGRGQRCGVLKKASLKDANVWRSRWFVLKDDNLFYCKSETNQREITAIPLLGTSIVKQDALVPFCFDLQTKRRVFRLCANSDDERMAWIHALHREIRLAAENAYLMQAESRIVDEAVTACERKQERTPFAVAGVLGHHVLRKMFRDFMVSESVSSTILLDTWVECDLFQRNAYARFDAHRLQLAGGGNGSFISKAQDEWDHVKRLLHQYIPAAIEAGAELNEADVELCRLSLHDNQKHRRLSIAMNQNVSNNNVADYPPPNLFLAIQQDILRTLEKGPFKRYIAGHGYTRILDRTIRR